MTEETPTKSDSKVTHNMYVWCLYVSFCRWRSASVLSLNSVLLSVKLMTVSVRSLIRYVYLYVVCEFWSWLCVVLG